MYNFWLFIFIYFFVWCLFRTWRDVALKCTLFFAPCLHYFKMAICDVRKELLATMYAMWACILSFNWQSAYMLLPLVAGLPEFLYQSNAAIAVHKSRKYFRSYARAVAPFYTEGAQFSLKKVLNVWHLWSKHLLHFYTFLLCAKQASHMRVL